ncbi:MAG TPA: chromate transporter, partial [Parvularculaceae bacterium]|nr:chromate transporter [Parvularculaceae bacterium]
MTNVSLRSLTAESFKVGCLGFGGPVGQIALMNRIFVEERGWIDEARYLHALNYCMLLPGPEAQQLAVYVGWVLRGVPGGLIAGTLFVLPGAAVIFALAFLYAASADAPAVAALFYGVKAAVVAIVAEAMLRIGKRAVKTRADLFVAAAAFGALYIFGAPFPLVILAAGAFGAIRAKPRIEAAPPPSAAPTPPQQAGEESRLASHFFPRLRGKWPEGPKGAGAERADDRQRSAQALLAAFVWAGLWL